MLCKYCEVDQLENEFNWDRRFINGREYKYRRKKCKSCAKIEKAQWHKQNQGTHEYQMRRRTNNRNSARRNRDFILNYLKNHPCIDCGISDIRVLEFDHVRGNKVKAVSHMAVNRVSLKRIQEEIEKCDVRCANCHKIKTGIEFNYRYED